VRPSGPSFSRPAPSEWTHVGFGDRRTHGRSRAHRDRDPRARHTYLPLTGGGAFGVHVRVGDGAHGAGGHVGLGPVSLRGGTRFRSSHRSGDDSPPVLTMTVLLIALAALGGPALVLIAAVRYTARWWSLGRPGYGALTAKERWSLGGLWSATPVAFAACVLAWSTVFG